MRIYVLDSSDDPFEYLRRQQERADHTVKPWQAAIRTGQYFQRLAHDISIYGIVLPDEEPREESLKYFRFTRCYSVACPEGELGDVHVSTIEKLLSEREFLEARSRGWKPW